jgi:hypothetical protein
MNWDHFLAFFGIRKPRSTRKLQKEKDSQALVDENKLIAYSKILSKNLTTKLIDRYFNTHDMKNTLFSLNDKFIYNPEDVKYYTSYKIYDELSIYFYIIINYYF